MLLVFIDLLAFALSPPPLLPRLPSVPMLVIVRPPPSRFELRDGDVDAAWRQVRARHNANEYIAYISSNSKPKSERYIYTYKYEVIQAKLRWDAQEG